MTTEVDAGPQLLLDWHLPDASGRLLRAGAGSAAAHVLILSLLTFLLSLDTGRVVNSAEPAQVHRIVTPLVAPPSVLTQKEPNRTKPAKEVRLENLLPERAIAPRVPAPPAPARKRFEAPPQLSAAAAAKPLPVPQPLQEPPRIEVAQKAGPDLPQAGMRQIAPPPTPPIDKPKLVLENPGQSGSAPDKTARGSIPVPKATVEDALHSIARGGAQGGVIVGDVDQPPSLGDTLRRPPTPGKTGSSLELTSDPMGVDFKPYLIRILAKVRVNWFAVMPESVKLGRRGRVTLEFAIDRSGSVPKLVISMPSGAEALDRAAVAGISASVPFPPLPKEFPGQQIRLKFAFQYNQ